MISRPPREFQPFASADAEPLPRGKAAFGAAPTVDEIVGAMRTVFDPEIPVNIYDLGLIYRIDIANTGSVDIDMTLTAPGCPVAGALVDMVKTAVGAVAAVNDISVNLVFDPPWDISRMSEDTQLELGLL